MTKREREALREYVGAVAAHNTVLVLLPKTLLTMASPEVYGRPISLDKIGIDTGARLNAADDRLRALGMLP